DRVHNRRPLSAGARPPACALLPCAPSAPTSRTRSRQPPPGINDTLSASAAMTSLERLAAFKPDTCSSGAGGIDWSSIGSASAMSAFCGIMAGFVFAGIVVVIGERNPTQGDGHASRALRLMLPCFV